MYSKAMSISTLLKDFRIAKGKQIVLIQLQISARYSKDLV